MKKHEFKRAWREFRTEVRAKQAEFTERHDSAGMTRDLDDFGQLLVAGFTKNARSIAAYKAQNNGKGIADLVKPTRGSDPLYWRREAVRISRLYGPISFGSAA